MRLLLGTLKPDEGEVWRKPDAEIAYVPQDVPEGIAGCVRDLLEQACSGTLQLVRAYETLAGQLNERSTPDMYERLEALQTQIDEANGWDVARHVDNALKRFKLDGTQPFDSLSGGMKRRVLIAQALFKQPQLLMLDEPTNHLDIDSIEWLEETLVHFQGAILFVTHDRQFLQRVATRIVDLDRGRLTSWPGDFETYKSRKHAALEAEENEWRRFDKHLAEEEAWIRQGIKARRTRNEGRVRALARLRKDRASRRERIGTMKLEASQGQLSGRDVVVANNVSFAWPDKTIVKDFSIRIQRGDRIGIVGPNGCGKSTLLKLILGQLEPQGGRVRLGTKLELLYFDQLRGQLDLDATVSENIADGNDTVVVGGKPRHVIWYLKDFLFSPLRCRSPVRVLSGGERNRLLLARLFKKSSNVLILDEPTNDLDAESLELLEAVLLDYQGTVLLVSHDRAFLDNVVTSTLAYDADGIFRRYAGGYADWLQQRATAQLSETDSSLEENPPKQKEKQPKKLEYKLSYAEKRELAELPETLEKLEKEQEGLEVRLADPELYRRDPGELKELTMQLESLQVAISAKYDRWAELEERRTKASPST